MERLTIGSRFLLRFVSEDVRTNMYIFLDGTRFLVIDPHPASEALAFLRKAGVSECTVLLTHEHPDHTCGIYSLQREWKTELICQEACGCAIADLNNNHPALIVAMLAVQDMRNGTNTAEHFRQYYEAHVYIPDVTFSTKFELKWGQERFSSSEYANYHAAARRQYQAVQKYYATFFEVSAQRHVRFARSRSRVPYGRRLSWSCTCGICWSLIVIRHSLMKRTRSVLMPSSIGSPRDWRSISTDVAWFFRFVRTVWGRFLGM